MFCDTRPLQSRSIKVSTFEYNGEAITETLLDFLGELYICWQSERCRFIIYQRIPPKQTAELARQGVAREYDARRDT